MVWSILNLTIMGGHIKMNIIIILYMSTLRIVLPV